MTDSEPDEDIDHVFEELEQRRIHDRNEEIENGEPPRRRMRMDDGAASIHGMTLRSRTLGSNEDFCSESAIPTASAPHNREVSDFERDNNDDDDNGFGNGSVFDDNETSVENFSSNSLANSPSISHFGSPSVSSILSDNSPGPPLSNNFDIDLDLDYESLDSFESYNLDELSDVPVNRSPSPVSDDSVDGESLYGANAANDDTGEDDEPNVHLDTESGDRLNQPDIWQRRRLQRRNAIIVENTDTNSVDSVDDEHENSQNLQETLDRRGTLSTRSGALLLNNNPSTDDAECLPSDDVLNKKTALEEEDGEVSNCIICCEPYENSGDHRLCCLKCGHTYGKFCIEKWIKNEARCPQCNAKASKRDVRVLYVRNLVALDTAERDLLRNNLATEREMKRKLELRNAQLDQQVKELDNKYKRLSEECSFLRERVGSIHTDFEYGYRQQSGAASNDTEIRGTTAKPLLSLLKTFSCKDGECRVGAYDEWLNMLAVSQTVKSPLYPLGSYGVKKINLLDMRETLTTPLHLKEIRDLEFNSQGDVLLSVGLDKRAILTNCNTNITVQAFNADYPLWSCAWSKTAQHLFYAGTSNGQVLVYDIRNGREAVKSLVISSEDRTPTAGLKFVTPSYGKGSEANFFTMTGLLVQKLTSVWFCELRNEEANFHQLPIEGSFLSVDYEPISRHALFSTKASFKGSAVPSRHIVCNLTQYQSTVQNSTMASCDIVQSYDGNQTHQATKMTRSSIFSPNKEKVLIAAEVQEGSRHITSIWDLSETKPQQTLIGREQVLSFVPCRVNNEYLLGSISSNNVNIYKVQP